MIELFENRVNRVEELRNLRFPTNNGKLIDVKRVKGVEKTEEKWYNKNNLTIEGKIVWKIKSRFLRINKSERLGTQTKKNGIFLWWT